MTDDDLRSLVLTLPWSGRVVACPRQRCGRLILQVCMPIAAVGMAAVMCEAGHWSTWDEVVEYNDLGN